MEKETKKCPYCGETIMATAKKCRYCGEWLTEHEENEQSANSEKAENGGLNTCETPTPVKPVEKLVRSNSKKPNKGAIAVLVVVLLVACGISSYYLVEPMGDFLIGTAVSYDYCEPLSYVLSIGLSVIVASLVGWLLIKKGLPKIGQISAFPKIRIGKRTVIMLVASIVILAVIGIVVFHIQKEKEETHRDLETYNKAMVSIKFDAAAIHLLSDVVLPNYIENWHSAIWKGFAYDQDGVKRKCSDFNDAIEWRISKYYQNGSISFIDSLYNDIEEKINLTKSLKHKPTDAPDMEKGVEELRSCSYDLKDFCHSPKGNLQSFSNAANNKLLEAGSKISSFMGEVHATDSARAWILDYHVSLLH